jgi:hypothetical protein
MKSYFPSDAVKADLLSGGLTSLYSRAVAKSWDLGDARVSAKCPRPEFTRLNFKQGRLSSAFLESQFQKFLCYGSFHKSLAMVRGRAGEGRG